MARRPAHSHRRSQQATRRDETSTLPTEFVAAARHWLPDEAEAFLTACMRPPRLAIRPNAGRGGLTGLIDLLGPAALDWPRLPWWDAALLPPPEVGSRLAAHALAAIGAIYAQDPTALAAVAALDPQPGERVLDLCAAPGGKATAIADRLAGRGLLVCNDIEERRAHELARTIERWGLRNTAVFALAPEALARLLPRFFDRVLVDAPCSGEAMFARRSRAAPDWSPAHVSGCATRQRQILDAARRMVRAGGRLVYATCTFNPHEDEEVVAAYLARYPDDTLDDLAGLPGISAGRPDLVATDDGINTHILARCARLWPHRSEGAGHFVAAIRVAGTGTLAQPPVPHAKVRRPASADASDAEPIKALLGTVAPGFAHEGEVVVRGDTAYDAPQELPAGAVESALAPGVRIAERRGVTWRPAHGLAMCLRPGEAARVVELESAMAARYLAGQPAPCEAPNGLALCLWRGYNLGWGRVSRQSLTPLLPSGLRRHRVESLDL